MLVTLVLLLGLAGGRGWGQERAAAYWCLEGNFSSDHGHMSYVDAQGTLHKDVLNIPVNAGKKPGITLQYATFYNGKIYAVSKQAKTSSSERLIRINPATWEIEKMGGAGFDGMDKELRTFHFLGVSDKEGYLSGSDARIYKIKLDDLSAEMVEGPGWDDLRDREVGNMILCRGKIVVEVYGHHEGIATDVFQHELWVLNVEDGSVRTKFPYKGLFNPVVTKDGRLLAVRVLGRSVKEKRYFIVELDIDKVSAAPQVLLEFSKDLRPADFQTQVWSWSQGHLYASTRENVLYFNTDRSMFQMTSIAKIDLNELKPTEVYKSENTTLYGISRENPHDGSIWVNLNGGWSPEDKLVRIVRENGVYKESDRYSFSVPYGFASCPFFEDRHRAEVAKPGRVCKVGVESEVDLCDLVEDKDGFSASVLFSDLKVGGNSGWKFELVDHHLLRVVKASRTESAQVSLKAFSSGLYSDLTFDFTSYQQLITHTTVGGKVEVLRENDGKILEDATELHKGDVLKISVVPDTEGDYILKSLRVNGKPWSSGDTYKVEDQSVTVDAEFALRPYSLVVTHTGEGEVKVVRRWEELESGAKVYKGEVLEIEPRPEADYKLKSLKINGEEISGQYKCTVGTGDVEVEAEFVEKPYVLTMRQSGEGKLKVERNGKTLSGGEKVDEGDKLKITAEPATSYTLKSITVNGALIKSGAVYTVQKGNVEVVGEFEEKPYTLTMEHTGNGRVAALWKSTLLENGAKVDKGDYLTITLVPEAGNKIGSFKINGQVQSGFQATYKVQGEDVHVEAEFIEQPCTLTMKQKGEGTLSVICQKKSLQNGAKIGRGDRLKVKAEPKAGYKLSLLTLNGTSIKSGQERTMFNDEDVEVVAEFVKKSYMLTMKSTGQGELKVSAKGKFLETGTGVDKGEVLIISAEPKLDYELSSLTVNGIDQESGGKFVVDEEDVVVKAEFVEKRYVLTTSHTGDGKVIVKEKGRVLENGSRVSQDEVLSIYVEPGIGWKLSSLNVNGIPKKNGAKTVVSDGDVEVSAEFVQVDYILSVSCFGDGTLTVTRGGDKLKSGAAVRKGEELKLTAAEGHEYTLKSLMVNGEKRKNGELFTVGSEDVIIVVEFVRQVAPVLYTLSYTDPVEGTITVQRGGAKLESGDKTLKAGDGLVITAAPRDAAKHELESLKVNGADFTSGGTYKVSGDVTVKAKFKEKVVAPVLYTLSYTDPAEGTITVLRGGAKLESGDKTLREGDELVITAEPKDAAKHELESFKVNGADFTSGGTYKVSGDVTVEAKFKEKAVAPVLYTLSYTDPAEGTITVLRGGAKLASGDKTLKAGDELVITAEPKDAAKHELASLKVNGADFESGKTFTVGAEDVTVEATFKPVVYTTLTIIQTGEGMLKVLRGNEELMNGEKLRKGDKLVIEAKPNSSDYKLVTLNVNGTPFASGSTYTVGDQNVRVEVVFDKSTAVESVLLAGVAATPNPCGARLTLRGASAAVQWKVYTVQGQLVARGVSAGEGEIEIATAGWIPGVYYVRLEATDGVRVLPVVKE